MALGTSELILVDGAEETMKGLKAYYASGASDAAYQDAVKFLRHRETMETFGNYLVQFDLLCKVAES